MASRFMLMHKHDQHTEAGERPGPELLARMGAFIGEHAQRGTFLGGEGLGASSTRTRLTFRGGTCTVKHGPYTGAHEFPSEALLLAVKSREEAIRWGTRFGEILGDGEMELGAVTEPWDLGFGPRPDNPPLRILVLPMADKVTESGQPRTPRQKADLARLKTEMTRAGVLVSDETLFPGSRSKRLQFTQNRLQVLDGPFADSKELIGGFAVLKLASMEEVIHECARYADILGGTVEMDVRPLFEPADVP